MPAVVVLPGKGKMSKQMQIPFKQQLTLEKQEEKILTVLMEELQAIGAPVLKKMWEVQNQDRVRASLLGQYRPSTARRYVACWQAFRRWTVSVTGFLPSSGVQLVDYLYVREEEGMGLTVPLSVSKGIAWFERVAGIPEWERLTSERLVDRVVMPLGCWRHLCRRLRPWWWTSRSSWRFGLHWGLTMLPTCVLIRWRTMTASSQGSCGGRKLQEVGSVSRSFLSMFQKKPGSRRRTGWLQDWLSWEGSGVPSRVAHTGRSEPAGWSGGWNHALPGGGGMELRCDEEPDPWEWWALDAGRMGAVLVGALRTLGPVKWPCSIGVQKPERDLLGRWKPEGSDTYVRTYNAAVTRMQSQFAEVIRQGDGYRRFDEGSVLEELKGWWASRMTSRNWSGRQVRRALLRRGR